MVLDPYATAVVSRQRWGELGQVGSSTCTCWIPAAAAADADRLLIVCRLAIVVPRSCLTPLLQQAIAAGMQDLDYGNGTLGVARTWPQGGCVLPGTPDATFDWQVGCTAGFALTAATRLELHGTVRREQLARHMHCTSVMASWQPQPD